MFTSSTNWKHLLLLSGMVVPLSFSCTKKEESANADSDKVSIKGQLKSESGDLNLDESMSFSCVSLGGDHELSSSKLSSTGNFQIDVKKDTLFSCYLNDEDGDHIASLVIGDTIEDSDGNILTDGGSAISLKSSADIGTVIVSSNGVINAEEEKFGNSISIKDPYVSVEELDGKTFKLTCAGASSKDRGCLEQIAETPSIFFAKIEPAEGNKESHVLVAWDSKGAYEACGQITTYQQDISEDGEVSERSQSYTFEDPNCTAETLEGNKPIERHGIAEIISVGDGYSYRSEEAIILSEGCVEYDVFSIDFTGDKDSMAGLFKTGSKFDGDCPKDYKDSLEVYFVNIEIVPETSEESISSSDAL